MSARAFGGIPRQFVKAMRFQRKRMFVPKMAPKMWRNEGEAFRCFQEMNKTTEFYSRNMRSLVARMRSMQRIQIGALYMFSYVSKEFLELLTHFEELIDDEEVDDEEKRTFATLTGRRQKSLL
ncbi:hypothetical protein JH06_0837 [Blastocystis sp. subtype 4]|uniref:hypothetical protein n=1 Tax=Blastocystis sp. subtype 4 TaxID=944170 RepID=UPI000711DDB8|nr:hypothetical protein JH06_0837 [Blastocystis sp. subtype 4]KNB46331.1 hypothetical protein JH06_0837 [Blastocystis sp. subtype 4]|eukprot:XP_014529772.1 hypothetical protein JH06_0837 [Blastocystis sp. subtype 4]